MNYMVFVYFIMLMVSYGIKKDMLMERRHGITEWYFDDVLMYKQYLA